MASMIPDAKVINPSLPPLDPDSDLMADLEGNKRSVRAYRREADTLRKRFALSL